MKVINSQVLKKLRILQHCRDIVNEALKERLARYIKDEVEILSEFDYAEGPISLKEESAQFLWEVWSELQSKHQTPGWIASAFEDGQFWVSRWELHYLEMLGDFYPEINKEMGFDCAGVFYLLDLLNSILLMTYLSEKNMPGTDDKTL